MILDSPSFVNGRGLYIRVLIGVDIGLQDVLNFAETSLTPLHMKLVLSFSNIFMLMPLQEVLKRSTGCRYHCNYSLTCCLNRMVGPQVPSV